MNDESIYEMAAEELAQGNVKRGLWAKSYASALGDEAKARALYITARVPQITEELMQLAQKQREQHERAKKVTDERLNTEIDRLSRSAAIPDDVKTTLEAIRRREVSS